MLLKNKSKKNHHPLELSPEIISRSKQILPVAGYFVLLFAALDYLSFLIPLHLFDPSWELETIGKCVENIWSLLLGLVMVFAHREQVKVGELKILAWLSRLILVVAMLYFLIVPLTITNAARIHRHNVANFKSQLAQQNTQYQQQQELLNNATEAQLTQSIQQRDRSLPSAAVTETPQQVRTRLLTKLESQLQRDRKQAQDNFQPKKWSLIKTTVKWSIGALISGIMLIWMWIYTDWVRKVNLGLKQR